MYPYSFVSKIYSSAVQAQVAGMNGLNVEYFGAARKKLRTFTLIYEDVIQQWRLINKIEVL